MFTTAALVLVTGLLGAPQQQAADLSVDLDARHTYLLPGATYSVSVTNHGPDALDSATVVVALEHPLMGTTAGTCAVDTAARTITCDYGPLPAGATATATGTVTYNILGPARPVSATATRTASTPHDPNPGNDTDTRTCWYDGYHGMPPFPWPPMTC
jgi:hypothetical protein